MNYLERIQRNIKFNYPHITPDELQDRMRLIKHMIALEHEKKLAQKKDNNNLK